MKKWSINMFAVFLWSHYPKAPLKSENAVCVIWGCAFGCDAVGEWMRGRTGRGVEATDGETGFALTCVGFGCSSSRCLQSLTPCTFCQSQKPWKPKHSCNSEILFSKTAFLRGFLCQRFLASTVDDGRIILRNSRPMLFSASGRRHNRIWGEKRTHLGRCSLTNIEIDLLGTLHHVSLGVAMSLTRCSGFIPISPWLLARLS